MIFKRPEMEVELKHSPKKIREVAKFFDETHKKITGKECIITCVWEKFEGQETLTHVEHRAFDARIEVPVDLGKTSNYINDRDIQEIINIVNEEFPISKYMNTCIAHRAKWKIPNGDVVYGLLHFHCQISRSQVLKDEVIIPV